MVGRDVVLEHNASGPEPNIVIGKCLNERQCQRKCVHGRSDGILLLAVDEER